MKKMNVTLKSVLVLSAISVVCVALLVVVNALWAVTANIDAALREICPADSYQTLMDIDDNTKNTEITAFNAAEGSKTVYVRRAYAATGGENDGAVIIESAGAGFGKGEIVTLTAYNTTGLIIGYGILSYDAGKNDRWGNLTQSDVRDLFLDTSYENITPEAEKNSTGATFSLNGIIDSVNISRKFFKDFFRENPPEPDVSEVTGQKTIGDLKALYATGSEPEAFYSYKYSTGYKEYSTAYGSAKVSAVYGDGVNLILEIKSETEEGFGKWTLLVLFDANKAIAAVNPTGSSYHDTSKYVTAPIDSAEAMTALFSGVNIDGVKAMGAHLDGTTGATDSSNGVKIAIICALSEIDDAMAAVAAMS